MGCGSGCGNSLKPNDRLSLNPNRSLDFHSYFVLLSAGSYPALSKM